MTTERTKINRVEDWRRFSRHMEDYIGTWTVEKYTVEGSEGCDLMSITRDWRVCVWNILKYALRLWNGHAKDHDFEKLGHYCEMAWTATQGKVLVEQGETEDEKESGKE